MRMSFALEWTYIQFHSKGRNSRKWLIKYFFFFFPFHKKMSFMSVKVLFYFYFIIYIYFVRMSFALEWTYIQFHSKGRNSGKWLINFLFLFPFHKKMSFMSVKVLFYFYFYFILFCANEFRVRVNVYTVSFQRWKFRKVSSSFFFSFGLNS